jgi:hypothetical protein
MAVRLPTAEGVNVRLTLQVPAGAMEAPEQVSALFAKSLAFVPVTLRVEIARFSDPVFVTVSFWAGLATSKT